ncbi:type IV pilus assembly protein PilM, partial [bacterium]|nr:type IV pilus assembly protein PilM [bacterium]
MMKSFVGIDIGTEQIKLVQLKKSKGTIFLEKAGMISVKDIPFYDGMSKEDLAAEGIKWLLAHNNIKSAVAAVSLPSSLVYSKYITLPVVSMDKIDQIIQFEARQQIPFPLDEVIWDYAVLGKSPAGEEINIVIHVVKKEIITSFLASVSESGIDAAIIDVMSMVLYNVLSSGEDPQGTMLVDIGAINTNIILIDKGNCWTRSLPVGGDVFTGKIAEKLQIPVAKAETLKVEVGLQGEGEDTSVSDCLKEEFANLVKEIQRTIGFYRSKSEELVVKKVVLTGGNSQIKGLLAFFMESLRLDVEMFDPFLKIDVSQGALQENVEKNKNSFAVAVGLGLRHLGYCPSEINLISKDILEQKYVAKNKIFLWLSVLVVFAFFCLANYSLIKNIEKNKKIAETADVNISEYSQMKTEINKLETDLLPMKSKVAVLEELSLLRMRFLDILLNI